MKSTIQICVALLVALQNVCVVADTDVESDGMSRSRVDRFVRGKQREVGVSPQPEADRRTLLRRLSFDLIGLPPTPDEVDAFVSDKSPHAYEKQVERLLASPRYGEHMAVWWLDLARYADSDGYHDDTNRSMWPYRDYVIDAFNKNKPFGEFTIEQLAGDLIPNATLEQQVATAFHRNAPTSSEDGANPDEYRARYAADRVNTTSQVWLGLTVQCAECHDHKYDPITTTEYYELFAFFNQTPEEPLFRGLYAPPSIAVPSKDQRETLIQLDNQISLAKKRFDVAASESENHFAEWAATLSESVGPITPEEMSEAVVCEFLFDEDELLANTGTRRRPATLVRTPAEENSKVKSKATEGPFGKSLALEGDSYLDLGQLFEVRQALPFTLEAWLKFDENGGPVFSKVDFESDSRGFEVRIVDGRVIVRLVEKWPDAAIQVATVGTFDPNEWQHLSVTFDGRLGAEGIFIYVNGQAQDLSVDVQTGTKRVRNRAPFLIGGGPQSRFHGEVDEVRFYKWALASEQLQRLPFRGLSQLNSDVESHRYVMRHFFVNSQHPPTIKVGSEIQSLRRDKQLLDQKLPRVRVMRDIDPPRETRVLVRGDFRSQGDLVEPGTPSLLPDLPKKSTRASRFDLATWIVTDNREQTAKVLVNRLWAQFFTRGIVETLDDFGVSGASATHPELLDWLRDELLRRDWDMKSLIREIVNSATYRQSSHAGAEHYARDPNNEFLARGPRHRFSAEAIRDNALATSGLLVNRIGGPSVKPYQPAGLWREMAKGDEAAKEYQPSTGESLYRRGVYTFWKRSIHNPTFDVLDAPSREVCTSSRPTTNTPTQALALLNDPTFVEAARVLAAKLMEEVEDFDARLQSAFRRVLARNATEREVEVLGQSHQAIRREYERDPSSAKALLSVGESRAVNPSPEFAVELATWTSLAQMILTLDEAISKE